MRPQLAVAEQMVELGRRHIDQEQDQNPNLDRREAMPGEASDHVRQEIAYRIVLDQPEPDQMLDQAGDKDDRPVNDRLEQDRPDQRGPIVAAKKGHRVGDQHRLTNDKRPGGGEHEAGKGDGVVGEDQIRRQHDQIEADKKEDRRRQYLAQLMCKPAARPATQPGRRIVRFRMNLKFRNIAIGPTRRVPHPPFPAYFAANPPLGAPATPAGCRL
jgi:hypothetical protein